ncbi:MAG: hypothetical protein R3B98_02000 [Hyphomonas sp.]
MDQPLRILNGVFTPLQARQPFLLWAALAWLVGGPLHPYVWNLIVQLPELRDLALPNNLIHLRSIAGALGMAIVLRMVFVRIRAAGVCTRFYLALAVLSGVLAATAAAIFAGLVLTCYAMLQPCLDGCTTNTALSNLGGALIASVLVLFGALFAAFFSNVVAAPIAYLATRLIFFRWFGQTPAS